MGTTTDEAPFPAFHFTVEINGIAYPFKSASGLKIETSVVELEEGGFNVTTRKLVGRTKYPNLVLKKGVIAGDSDLYKLKLLHMKDYATPGTSSDTSAWVTPDRFAGTVTQMGPEGRNIKWYFSGAFISKWEGPELDATKNEVSVESIEISHNGLVMLDAAGPGTGAQAQPPPAAAPPPTSTTVNFGSGSADSSGNAAVQAKGQDLAKNPDKNVRVEGHTDNVGGASMNLKLSQQRADGVRQQLISSGAKPEQVTSVGYGEDQPIADNSTAAGRAQNRRVEIIDV